MKIGQSAENQSIFSTEPQAESPSLTVQQNPGINDELDKPIGLPENSVSSPGYENAVLSEEQAQQTEQLADRVITLLQGYSEEQLQEAHERDSSWFHEYIDEQIQQIVHESSPLSGYIGPLTYKAFAALLSRYLEHLDDVQVPPESIGVLGNKQQLIQHEFFSSDILTNNIHGEDKLALLQKAIDKPQFEYAYDSLIGAAVYDFAFSWQNPEKIQELFNGKSNAETLNLLRIYTDIAKLGVDEWYTEGRVVDRSIEALQRFSSDKSALLQLYVQSTVAEIRVLDMGANDWLYITPEQEGKALHYQEDEATLWKGWQDHSDQLRQIEKLKLFYSQDEPIELMQIAKDAVAVASDRFVPQKIILDSNQAIDLDKIIEHQELNSLGLNFHADLPTIMRRLHEPEMRVIVESYIHSSLAELPLQAQLQLLQFLVNANEPALMRLSESVAKQPQQTKTLLLESFLALEMGDEFGDILLKIAEKLTPEQLKYILQNISIIREEAQQLTANLAGNPEYEDYARGINLAIVKRVTEVLSIVPDLADGQKAVAEVASLGYMGPRIAVTQCEDAAATLRVIAHSLQKINQNIREEQPTISSNIDQQYIQAQYSDTAITGRERESDAGEARLSFRVRFSHEELVEMGLIAPGEKADRQERVFEFRLDHEKPTGRVSLDLGTTDVISGKDLRTLNLLVGVVVAAGAQQLARKRGQEISTADNHVRDAFTPEQADTERFAGFTSHAFDSLTMRNELAPAA